MYVARQAKLLPAQGFDEQRPPAFLVRLIVPDRSVSVQAVTVSSTLPSKKRQHCCFAPNDDQRLRACRSRSELLEVIAAIALDTNFSRRNVVNHAKELGVWDKFQTTRSDDVAIVRLLNNPGTQEDLLAAVAERLRITRSAARRRIYRDDNCVECLLGGNYSAREVAEGFCMRRSTLSALVQSGVLRAKHLQRTGKLRISSDAIVDFVLGYPRQIQWSRCLQKSSWLRDILESARYREVAAILCVSPKTLRSWIERGILHLKFDPENVSELFSDEPVYRMLDEYPELIAKPKCVAASPEWFARYEAVRGRYPKRPLPGDRVRPTEELSSASFRILLRRG
jgi:hypothetical protein